MMGLKKTLMHYTWNIAYGIYTDDILIRGLDNVQINIIKNPYPTKWFADPFILEENSNFIQFFVEEFDSSIGRGRIARLLVDKKDNEIKECKIILDRPTHLSFPAIYRVGDKVYVHPENSASGSSYIYRYDRESDKLVDPLLLLNEPLTDAIIKKMDDGYHMFATRVPDSNSNILLEYFSTDFFGPYILISEQIFSSNTARMAGCFVDMLRPAQDCTRDYGKAVVFYNGNEEIYRISSDKWLYDGLHTFNVYNNSFVIDLKKYDFPLFYKLIRMIRP